MTIQSELDLIGCSNVLSGGILTRLHLEGEFGKSVFRVWWCRQLKKPCTWMLLGRVLVKASILDIPQNKMAVLAWGIGFGTLIRPRGA